VFGYDPNETDSKWTQAGELAEHNPNKALTWSSMILITLFRWLYGGSDESADLCEPNQAAGKTWTGCLYSANKQPKSICFCLYTMRSDHAWIENKVSPRRTGNERMGIGLCSTPGSQLLVTHTVRARWVPLPAAPPPAWV
jgi:hypothetical protein